MPPGLSHPVAKSIRAAAAIEAVPDNAPALDPGDRPAAMIPARAASVRRRSATSKAARACDNSATNAASAVASQAAGESTNRQMLPSRSALL